MLEAALMGLARRFSYESVCSCVGVTDRRILGFIARTGERRLDAVQAALSCGTGCGSCRMEVARLVAEAPATPTRRA